MRCAALLLLLALSHTSLLAARPEVPALSGADSTLSENFSVTGKTIVPGRELAPGDYKITIIEHLSDRVILQIANKDGKVLSTFLGIIDAQRTVSANQGPIRWNGQGTPALRGFSFPGASSVEFVYPKVQAVTIAKSNDNKVLAIDPASDNLPSGDHSLSTQDMQIVTLWSLTATRVGPDATPAIEAARYQVPSQAAAAPVYVARATPPPAPASAGMERGFSAAKPAPATRPLSNAVASTSQARVTVPRADAPKASATVVRKRAIAVLPHTASNMPLMLLGSVLALFGAAALRFRRINGL